MTGKKAKEQLIAMRVVISACSVYGYNDRKLGYEFNCFRIQISKMVPKGGVTYIQGLKEAMKLLLSADIKDGPLRRSNIHTGFERSNETAFECRYQRRSLKEE